MRESLSYGVSYKIIEYINNNNPNCRERARHVTSEEDTKIYEILREHVSYQKI